MWLIVNWKGEKQTNNSESYSFWLCLICILKNLLYFSFLVTLEPKKISTVVFLLNWLFIPLWSTFLFFCINPRKFVVISLSINLHSIVNLVLILEFCFLVFSWLEYYYRSCSTTIEICCINWFELYLWKTPTVLWHFFVLIILLS